jgi:PAS domain S-box-containing protein
MGFRPFSQQHILFTGKGSSELARNVIDALFVFVAVLSKDGHLIEANAASLQAAGVTLDEVRGKHLWDLYWWNYSPELQDKLRTACDQAGAGHTVRFDSLVRMAHESRPAIDFQVAPLRNPAGNVTHLVACAVDITKRKNAEDELRERDRRKDAFIGALAHELRNPLAPIRNALELLKRVGSPEPRAVHARDVIDRQVMHLVGLLDDLLDIARIAGGKMHLDAQLCDLCAVVLDTAEDYRATLENAGCSFTVRKAGQPLVVRADPVRLGQMIRNYLQNAQRFASGAGVLVECGLDAAANCGVVTVTDTGPGFTAETAARLFEPFGQADQRVGRAQGGMGLGLALTKGLAELQGGSVAARSAGPGQGACFEIRLPLVNEQLRVDEGPPPVAPTQSARNHVLLVEDHKDTAETMQVLLEAQGYTVFLATDGMTALSMAQMWRPEVVISDIGLPGMTGYEFAQCLRAQPAFGDTLLVAVSGYADEDARQRSKAAGFDVHFAKPVDPNELLRALETAAARATLTAV